MTALLLYFAAAIPAGLPAWTFDEPEGLAGWEVVGNTRDAAIEDGVLSARIVDGTMFLVNNSLEPFATSPYHRVELRIRAERQGFGSILWDSESASNWSQRMPFQVKGGGAWETVTIYPFWQNVPEIGSLRLDLYPGRFEVDSIRFVPWETASLPPVSEPGALPETVPPGTLESAPGVSTLFLPPVSLRPGPKRVAQVRIDSEVDFESALVFVSQQWPGFYREPFPVEAGSGEAPYNVYMRMLVGRAGSMWREPLVALGVEIPTELRDQVTLRSIHLTDVPEGPGRVHMTYLGFSEAANRAGRNEEVVAEFDNIGGEPYTVDVTLETPPGLRVAGEAAREVTVPPMAEGHRVAWTVEAERPGAWDVAVRGGEEAAQLGAASLRFLPPVDLEPADYVPEPSPVETDPDVFMFYFPGWSEYSDWDCIRLHAPERRPLLGYYDESRVDLVDWQIKMAVENGIDGFILDWYWGYRLGEGIRHEAWVEAYEKSRYRDDLKLMIMWCNHIGQHTQESLVDMVEFIVDRYFHWPSYYHVDGKPVIVIWDTARLRGELGGSEEVRAAFDACARVAVDAGFDGITWLVADMHQHVNPSRTATLRDEGYSGLTTYHHTVEARHVAPSPLELEYADVVRFMPEAWEKYRIDAVNHGMHYFPIVETGWDSHPWHGVRSGVQVIRNRTPELFEAHLRGARTYWEEHRPPFIVLGPANEWGEGSYIEPCVEFDFDMYEAIRKALGKGDPARWPVNIGPRDVGLPLCDHPPLPERSAWDFSDGDGGWAPFHNIADFEAGEGVLSMRSTTNDPAMTCDVVVPTEQYREFVVRMAATGDVDETMGQIFWGMRDNEMWGEASGTFTVTVDGEMREYVVELIDNPLWSGTTRRLRFDPVATPRLDVVIDAIELR